MLKAILFIIVKSGNCSDVCSSVGEWANKLVYSYNRTLFSKMDYISGALCISKTIYYAK